MTSEAAQPTDAERYRDLPPQGWPRLRVLLARALKRWCPLCGMPGIFRNWFTLRDACPRCEYRFDREDGYFLGAYALNLIVAELITVAVAVALLIWWDASWVMLEIVVVPLAIGLPLLFFPYSRAFWMVIDLMADPRVEERRLRESEMAEHPQ